MDFFFESIQSTAVHLKLNLTLLLSLFCGKIFAQSNLSGVVADSAGHPLSYATITCKTQEQTMTLQTANDGSFLFKEIRPGACEISAVSLGYEQASLHFIFQKDTTLSIRLQEKKRVLQDITVRGKKAVIEHQNGKTVYNLAGSIAASGSDALQAVSQLPGIQVNGNEIHLAGRGMVRVMVDNRVLQLSGADLVHYLKTISANELSKIELLTNPGAKYEADGNAGLINIITRRERKQGYSGNLQLASKLYAPGESSVYGVHTFGELGGNGNIAYNSGSWSAYGSFNYVSDRHLEGFGTNLYYPHQSWLQTDTGLYTHKGFMGIAGIDYSLSPRTSIGVSYQGGKTIDAGADHVNNPIYNSNGLLDSTLKTYADYYPVAVNHSVNMHTVIGLDTAGNKLSFNADYFTHYRTDHSNFESNSYTSDGMGKPGSRARYYDDNKQIINVYTLKADADMVTAFARYTVGTKLSFISNYSNAFYYNKTDNDELVYNTILSNEFDYTENTQAIYASMSKDLSKWKFQAGLRGELTQTKGYSHTLKQTTRYDYFKLFPSLLVSYQPDKNNGLSFSLSRRINRPSFWNLNPFKSLYTAYSYGEGNPYLQPEYNNNFELTHTYKNILTTSFFLNVTGNGFNYVTIAAADTNLVYTRPLNFIKTYRLGVSENIAVKPFSWWESNQLLMAYHTDAQSFLPGVNDISGWGAYLASNNTFFFNQNRTLAALVNFWCQFPEINHNGRSNTYYKLDLGMKATTSNKKWDIVLNLNDVFMRSAPAISSVVNGIPQQLMNFQFNRFCQLSLNYRFGNNSGSTKSRSTGNEDERGRAH